MIYNAIKIHFIDEPHNQVHSAESRKLGTCLSNYVNDSSEISQLFCTAHDVNFLLGLLDGNAKIQVIRLFRNKDNQTCATDVQDVGDVCRNSFFKETGALQALFHSTSIVCESDMDCRFYRMVLERSGKASLDFHFIPTFSKQRICDVVSCLREFGLDCKIIADIDFLTDGMDKKKIISFDWYQTGFH